MNRCACAAGALLLLSAMTAHALDWRMDPAASRLGVRASYQGEAAPGVFKQFDTRLRFDPTRLKDSSLTVTVKLASIDMGSTDINDTIRDPEWFDLRKFTEAEFRSTDIKPAGAGRYIARGTLRLKGVEQPVEVPFNWKADGKTATMTGDVVLKRTAFGIGTGEWASGELIGLDVKVDFNVRLLRVN